MKSQQYAKDRFIMVCQVISFVALLLIILMVLLNTLVWIFPIIGAVEGGYGFSFFNRPFFRELSERDF